jgi:DeoR family fructose operon transcriptional repressor
MILEERRQNLVDTVRRQGFVSLPDLARELGVSESTIRRDLDSLDEMGMVKRTHGGAFYTGGRLAMPAFDDRTTTALAEKQAIARLAAGYIEEGEAVLLDGGTTTFEVARCLLGRSLQVVTNSLPIAHLFAASPQADLILIGGYVYPRTGVALGPLSQQMLADVHVRHTIMSVGGVTEKGLFNSNLLLVETERKMMQAADEVMVVADSTKFGRQALAHLAGLDEVDRLIVDSGLSQQWRQRVQQTGVELVLAEPEPVED